MANEWFELAQRDVNSTHSLLSEICEALAENIGNADGNLDSIYRENVGLQEKVANNQL